MGAAFEVICALAATLWICFVVAALAIGYRVMVKLRSRRRRINRLLDVVFLPIRLSRGYGVTPRRRVLRLPWRQVPPRRTGVAGHYDRTLALLLGLEPDRVIANLVARAAKRSV
jgi:hypothetical protein